VNVFLQDVRYALRRLVSSPGYALVAVHTLALGIGANSAIFSVVDGVLLRPLPFRDAERLVMLGHHYPQLDLQASVSAPGYARYRTEERIFENAAAATMWGANLAEDGDAARLEGARVTASFFPTLGVAPLLGRGFVAEDEQPGGDRSVLLSEGLWRQRFGADPSVLGRTLLLDGETKKLALPEALT
jgi:putative ABC transport system permease protein